MAAYVNEFQSPHFIEETIIKSATHETVGKIRVKPVSLLWKPKGEHKYYAIGLDEFAAWITRKETGAKRTVS